MDYRGEKNPKNLKITIAKIQQLLKLNFLANDEKKGISSAHQEAAPKKKKKRKQNRTKVLPQTDYSMMKYLKHQYLY